MDSAALTGVIADREAAVAAARELRAELEKARLTIKRLEEGATASGTPATGSSGCVLSGSHAHLYVATSEAPLGAGAYGEVWRAVTGPAATSIGLPAGLSVVIKSTSYRAEDGVIREVHALHKVRCACVRNCVYTCARACSTHIPPPLAWQLKRHPHIIHMLDHWVDPSTSKLNVVLEFAAGGTLSHHVSELVTAGRWSVATALLLMADMARGLEYAHGMGVWHRDIKPDNVLVTSDGRAVISDFGLARDMSSGLDLTVSKGVGSPLWMAIEVISKQRYTAAADVWSLGVVYFQLLVHDFGFGGWPFWDASAADSDLVTFVKSLETKEPNMARLPPTIPVDVKHLLGRMLSKDPSRRPSATVVCAVVLCALDCWQRGRSGQTMDLDAVLG